MREGGSESSWRQFGYFAYHCSDSTRCLRYGSAKGMKTNISLRCICGNVRGVATNVSPETGNRLVCMCDDCQAYAYYLGRADEMLDENGGTDIYQLSPSQIVIESGKENIRCVRLTSGGLIRWYASCCNSAIGNTLGSAKISFVGMPHTFMDHQGDGRKRDEVLGPCRLSIYGCYGKGKLPLGVHPKVPFRFFVRVFCFIVSSSFKKKNFPSPFFDETSGKPVVEPKILSDDQRERLFVDNGLRAN